LKRPIAAGFFILAACVLAVKLSPYFLLSALFLILANIGSSFIEPLRDIYFFNNVSKDEEDDLYGIYTTSEPLAKFIGPSLIATCFLFMPFEWVYVVFAGIFLIGGLFTLRLKTAN